MSQGISEEDLKGIECWNEAFNPTESARIRELIVEVRRLNSVLSSEREDRQKLVRILAEVLKLRRT